MHDKKELIMLKKEDRKNERKSNYRWLITITSAAFVISIFFSYLTESIIPKSSTIIGILLCLVFILIGILFDIIGVAVTSANEEPFHSMASRKVKGANMAVKLIKTASKVSSFCNDVIGDICGIISGTAGIFIAETIADYYKINSTVTALLITAIIASLTIGGKAYGKTFAINRSNEIVYKTSKILDLFSKK